MEPGKNKAIRFLAWAVPILIAVWGIYVLYHRSQVKPSMIAFKIMPTKTIVDSNSNHLCIGEVRYYGIKPFEIEIEAKKTHVEDLEHEPVDASKEVVTTISSSGDRKVETRIASYAYEKTNQGIDLTEHLWDKSRAIIDPGNPGSVIEKAEPGDTVFRRVELSRVSLQTFSSRFS